MSLKENIEMVKEELNSEEKFFEKAVITEKFVKKYKKLLITLVLAVIVVIAANIAYNINKQNQVSEANEALAILSKDSKNYNASAELKSLSPNLYDVWLFSQAIANKDLTTLDKLKNSNTLIVSDLVSYELAQNAKDASALNDYSLKQGAIFKDLALVQSAVLLINDNKIDEAHEKLSSISTNSTLYKLVQALSHYGVK
ncbi:MAG: hypothetical protein COB17_04325 [Sulfurimonas sp.]|nr:MAG: hypothetical protein COB17_04325 [Sulfurimonas sp.]